jgi:hypothetical protein
LLAESLLFYERTRIIADPAVLKQLVAAFGPELLLEYLEEGLDIVFEKDGIGITTTKSPGRPEVHDPVVFALQGLSLRDVAEELFVETLGRASRGRRLARRFSDKVEVVSYLEGGVLSQVREDYRDPAILSDGVGRLLRTLAPEYMIPNPLQFRVEHIGRQLTVETNIDFAEANRSYHRRVSPDHSSLSVAHLLSHFSNVHTDLFFAARYDSELATNTVTADLIRQKVASLIRGRTHSATQLELFQDFVFDDSRAIRDAFLRGERTFAELLEILSKRAKFREWVAGLPPDANIAKAYHREVVRSGWIDKLPAKGFRWSVFTGLGVFIDAAGDGGLGTAAGIALSAGDEFLLERLLRKWRPNQFIEGALADLLELPR